VSELQGSPVVKSNTIAHSTTAAIDLDCSQKTIAENKLFSARPSESHM
jgi:hypothetical protein